MAPNIFICLRNALCPLYWLEKGTRVEGKVSKSEHWDSPVPGTYRFIPGRGWHLIRRDDDEEDSNQTPVPVVYCRIVHRYLFASEMEQRCRYHKVVLRKDEDAQRCLFFRLDDGFTWVIGWDSRGKFIPGPYRKWCYDKETMTMRRMTSYESSSAATSPSTSRSSSIA
ncbi:hypothetical protein BGW36DRAFT_298011 [Talaromyces proteolyticus]|uniref:Uncharacterized protein n=1 Tax=Talaromyces proteolyticus TaxID=1131652 RepID=A0AAD4KNI7_9EURO|nr:uncharacterized protein BGW36DRAFT_298011 [Talaromyces proteolyticus]KAH8696688.1 hypothetical protein BGW36DRAFT_298011 [Talaromyces proteolyticus]